MKQILLVIVGGVAVLVAGFFALNSYIYYQKQAQTEDVEPYRATLSGEYVCLPHKDGSPLGEGECEFGIKTPIGEYYTVNFFLMSQGPMVIEPGQHFTANGVVTTRQADPEKLERYPIEGEFSVTDSVVIESTDDEATTCSAEAMLCPDGSYVGRSGPNCEFATCPTATTDTSTADNTDTTVTVGLGKSATALGVTISPQALISDSRCSAEVQCIWAGTVEVRTTLATAVAQGEHVLSLGVPQTFGDYTVTLIEVSPVKTQEPIAEGEYRFTFEVKG